nr:hypothetical protein [candidate division Zixibacteria bacterium]
MKGFVLTGVLILALCSNVALAQINSAQSGPWQDLTTWDGGVVPSSFDDVVISSGHTVSVDDEFPECHSLSFADNTALIDMNAGGILNVYGDFTLAAADHNVFSAGWSASGAYIRFTGSEPVQTLSGWNTGGGSTSFRDMIIDKEAGTKVVTAGSGMRFCLQNSLEIISGILEISPDDDLEARWASSGNLTGNQNLEITIQPDGEFLLIDGNGTHFIRSNTSSVPIGKMTIYGRAEFYDASSYDISIAGIDVKDGGTLHIGTYLGSSTYGPEFNPGTINVEDGGTLYNVTTTDIWFDTTIVNLNEGGEYRTISSSTVFPPTFNNNGKVRYMRNSSGSDQEVVDTDYYGVEFSYSEGSTRKLWTLTDDRNVLDSLTTNNSAELLLAADNPHTLTVEGTVRMTSGLIDNSDSEVSLAVSDGTLISRATGQIAVAPVFLGGVNLRYTSSVEAVVAGPEMPTDPGVLDNLSIASDQGVALSHDIAANGNVVLEDGPLMTDTYTLTLGPDAALDETAGFIVLGNAVATRTLDQAVSESFGNLGLKIEALDTAPGETTVRRVTGTPLMIDDIPGIARYFDINPTNNTGLNATLVIHYNDDELNGIPEALLAGYASDDGGSSWNLYNGTVDLSANTFTLEGLGSMSLWTLGRDTVTADNILIVKPDPMFAFMEYPYGNLAAIFYLGGEFAGGDHGVGEIDPASVRVNGLTPLAVTIISSYPGFASDVLEIELDIRAFIDGYPLLWDVSDQTYTITGSFSGGGDFDESAGVQMIGHKSGDANFDYRVNILDATHLINYLYRGAEPPQPIVGTGDTNGDGNINILDVTRLINYLYSGGPAPTHP